MKNLLFIFSLLFLFACGGNKAEDGDSGSGEKIEATDGSSCDEFLDDYEEWAEKIVDIFKKAKEDPTNEEYSKQMMEASQEISKWSEKWTELYDCTNDEKYAKRMEKIKEKIEKEMM